MSIWSFWTKRGVSSDYIVGCAWGKTWVWGSCCRAPSSYVLAVSLWSGFTTLHWPAISFNRCSLGNKLAFSDSRNVFYKVTQKSCSLYVGTFVRNVCVTTPFIVQDLLNQKSWLGHFLNESIFWTPVSVEMLGLCCCCRPTVLLKYDAGQRVEPLVAAPDLMIYFSFRARL